MLNLAKNLELPVDAITQKFAFLARTGAGKTYAATKLCELMLDIGAQVVALDPVGVWYGLRLAADGKGKGFSIPVFGGEHGDLPLEPEAGALIARLIVEKQICAVLDVSTFRKEGRKRFVTDFAEELFHLKKTHRSPIHIFFEECQKFVPQKTFKGEERMLGAFEDLIRLGRNYGIGASLISQRPQSVNKEVLNQTECLFAFQTSGIQERKTIKDWISAKGIDEDIAEILPKLEVGEAHIWSPQWLKISLTAKVFKKKTYDASATPVFGEKIIKPKDLSPVDVEKIKTEMADVVQRSEENDPKKLKQKIAELMRQINEKPKTVAPAEVVVFPTKEFEELRAFIKETEMFVSRLQFVRDESLKTFRSEIEKFENELDERIKKFGDLVGGLNSKLPIESIQQRPQKPVISRPVERTKFTPSQTSSPSTDGKPLPQGERSVLIAVAQHTGGVTRDQVTILTGYKRSTRDAYILRLAQRGYVETGSGQLYATEEGIAALGNDYEPLPTSAAIRDYWLNRLPQGESAVFSAVAEVYPASISRDDLSDITEYKRSTRDAYILRLRVRKLIETVGSGEVRASANLFD